jgi:glycosyltransferase involved in cell wall biosynthesis
MIQERIKFSIIIPTFNRAHLIAASIQSVLSQSYSDWELLICDDASTDHTKELISSFRDDRIKYFSLPTNQGNAAARNLGVKNSSYKWITFIDSDDIYEPEYLSEFSKCIQSNPTFLFFFCGYRVMQNNKVKGELIWRADNSRRGSFLQKLQIGIGCGVVVHRTCFDDVGFFDDRLRSSVDTDFLIRLEMIYSFCVVNKILISIYVHDGPRVRKNAFNMMDAYRLIIQKHKNIILANKNLLQRWYYKYMWLQFHAHNIPGGNESYRILKEKGCLNFKTRFIHAIFNALPVPIALFIHKKVSV